MDQKTIRTIPLKLSEKIYSDAQIIDTDLQLMKVGTFRINKKETIEITRRHLTTLKQNFDDKVRKIDLMIDFAHDSDKDAAAWITEVYLQNDDNELWVKVDWTPKGEKAVRNKSYRYISADFDPDYMDNETQEKFGFTLLGAGLTNRPVIKGMEPLILSEINNNNNKEDQMTDDMKKKFEEMEKKMAEKDKQIKELTEKLACRDKEMGEMKKEKKLAEEKAEKERKLAEEKAEKEKALTEKKGKFDKMLSEGKAVEAQREAFMADDMMKFAENAGAVNLSENGTGHTSKPKNNKNSDTPVQDKVIKLAEEKVKKDGITFSEAQREVFEEDEKLYEEYEAELEKM